jgi:hypothetical protein
MARTVLEEMTTVLLAVPRTGATDEEVAAWYELKARLLEHIAAEGGPDTEETAYQAELAHRRSQRLLAACARRDTVPRPIGARRSGGPLALRGPCVPTGRTNTGTTTPAGAGGSAAA